MSNRTAIVAAVLCAVVGLGLGVIIGYFSRHVPGPEDDPAKAGDPQLDVAKMLLEGVNRTRLEENLRYLTKNPHIAGSDEDEKVLVDYVATKWREVGISVEIHPYPVMLSYPNKTKPNYVALRNPTGQELLKSEPHEKILDDSQNSSDVVSPFNAYSPAGQPEGELVYVNFGRIEDFHLLSRNLSVNVTGRICIARYGRIFRGDKARHAEQEGCIGLILYSDPMEYTVPGEGVYPDSWYLPKTGAQRGTLKLKSGDIETPGYPSIDTAWRSPQKDFDAPHIPVTPIGYGDAMKYLEILGGPEAPPTWQGGLNITYHLGPGFIAPHSASVMKMHVNTQFQKVVIHNVIGYIRGTEEPDRYIIYGAHRDAWVFGAIDPSSAQSILIELGLVFGQAVRNGWKPRRTIVLCSWGAEEFGLVGSTEWVEEFQKNLEARAVVYINTDTAITGRYSLYAAGVPSLKELAYEVAKSIPNPDTPEVEAGRKTIYDTWKRRWPENPTSADSKPFVRTLGSGSDYTSFLQLAGVSCLDFAYAYDITTGIDFYPVYHSVYETFDYMKKFVDPDFSHHEALARLMAEIGRRLADAPILPFNVNDYAEKLFQHRDQLIATYGAKMAANGIDADQLNRALDGFQTAAKDFHFRVRNIRENGSDLVLRGINDQLMQLERAFKDPNGIGGRTHYRHAIYAPSQHNRYGSTAFPGFVDSLFDIDADRYQAGRWDEARRQYSILLFHISSATSTLKDFTPMKGSSNGEMA